MAAKKTFGKLQIRPFSIRYIAPARKVLFELIDLTYAAAGKDVRDGFKNVYDEARFEKMFAQKNGVNYVMFDGEELIGVAFGWHYGGRGNLHWVGVKKGYRGIGLTTHLAKKLIQDMRRRGAFKIELFVPYTNKRFISIFHSLGFSEKTRLEKDKIGYNLTYLVKRLRKPTVHEATKRIKIIGTGGQGVKLFARILAKILSSLGYYVSLNLNYDSAVRGGDICADFIFSEYPIDSPMIAVADIVVDLEGGHEDDIHAKEVIVEHESGSSPKRIMYHQGNILFTEMPIKNIAHTQFGSPVYVNMLALGSVLRHIGINIEALRLEKQLPPKYIETNIQAIKYGFTYHG